MPRKKIDVKIEGKPKPETISTTLMDKQACQSLRRMSKVTGIPPGTIITQTVKLFDQLISHRRKLYKLHQPEPMDTYALVQLPDVPKDAEPGQSYQAEYSFQVPATDVPPSLISIIDILAQHIEYLDHLILMQGIETLDNGEGK